MTNVFAKKWQAYPTLPYPTLARLSCASHSRDVENDFVDARSAGTTIKQKSICGYSTVLLRSMTTSYVEEISSKPLCSGGGARRILLAPTHYSGRCFCQETNAMPTPSTWCLLLYVPMSNNRNTRRRRAPHRPKATTITASCLGWRGEQLQENAPFQLELCHDGVYEREASSGLLPCRQLFFVLVPRYLPANISTCGETQKMRLNPYRGIYYCKNDHTNSK